MTVLLWLHVPALLIFGLATGVSFGHALFEVVPVASFAIAASLKGLGRRGRSVIGSALDAFGGPGPVNPSTGDGVREGLSAAPISPTCALDAPSENRAGGAAKPGTSSRIDS